MTIEKYAEGKYPFKNNAASIEAFKDGLNIGAEFAEWASLNDWYAIKDGGQVLWMNNKSQQVLPTPEPIELFLDEKMKQDASK